LGGLLGALFARVLLAGSALRLILLGNGDASESEPTADPNRNKLFHGSAFVGSFLMLTHLAKPAAPEV